MRIQTGVFLLETRIGGREGGDESLAFQPSSLSFTKDNTGDKTLVARNPFLALCFLGRVYTWV